MPELLYLQILTIVLPSVATVLLSVKEYPVVQLVHGKGIEVVVVVQWHGSFIVDTSFCSNK